MTNESFENVKSQIGYCGIWCGSCVAGNGALRELTGRFADVVGNYGLEEWVPPCFDFKEFSKGLESIEEMPLCGGCRSGDGSPDCPMRLCAIDRGGLHRVRAARDLREHREVREDAYRGSRRGAHSEGG